MTHNEETQELCEPKNVSCFICLYTEAKFLHNIFQNMQNPSIYEVYDIIYKLDFFFCNTTNEVFTNLKKIKIK